MPQSPNWVLWFVQTIKEFGGEYIPFRPDDEEPKVHTDGRRETRIPLRNLDPTKYFIDAHGSVRRQAELEFAA